MTIKQRREYFDDKKNWKVDDDNLAEVYGIRIKFLEFRGNYIYEEENLLRLDDVIGGGTKTKWCHGYYFILEDGTMSKVGITEICELMKEWDKK